MLLKQWKDLPEYMQCKEIRIYYDILSRKKTSLLLKRIFDLVISALMLVLLSPLILLISIAIEVESPGPVFFRQIRITQYGKKFKIYKFRTMILNADRVGPQITVQKDVRITKIGRILRGCRLDEIPQLINILRGEMTFVGARPEVPRYVETYTCEMRATLLLPAGVTSEASIHYKDESIILNNAEEADKIYIEDILPGKMRINLMAIKNFSFLHDIKIMFETVGAIINRKSKEIL